MYVNTVDASGDILYKIKYIQCFVCWHYWYSSKALILSFAKFQLDWKSIEYLESYEQNLVGNVDAVNTVEKP